MNIHKIDKIDEDEYEPHFDITPNGGVSIRFSEMSKVSSVLARTKRILRANGIAIIKVSLTDIDGKNEETIGWITEQNDYKFQPAKLIP